METQNPNSRKRTLPPHPSMEGIFTRSKSQIYFHRNRSGRGRFDSTRFMRNERNFQTLYPIIRKRKHPCSQQAGEALSDLNDVSRNLRVRRVFSPSSVIDENGENSELGLKSPSLGSSGTDYTEIIGTVLEDLEKGEAVPKEAIQNCENGRERESDQHSVKLIRPNESSSTNKMVVKPGLLRKVFKTSSSFSYRRLLPFLMDSKKDDSCASEIEVDDTRFESTVQNMNNVKSNSLPDKNKCDALKNEPMLAHSDASKPLQSGELDKLGIRSPCNQLEQNCDNLPLTQTKVNVGLQSVENTMCDNILNGIDDAAGESLSMTPPDPDIFNKFDASDSKAIIDQSDQQIENKHLGNPSNGLSRSNNACTSKKSYQNPSERNGSSWKTEMILNPCSRKKVLKLPSSVSYRRLLPYLMDVAKDTKDEPKFLESKDSNPLNSQASATSNASEVLTANLSAAMASSTSVSTIKRPILVQSEDITEPIISFSLEMDGAPKVECILSDTTNQLEPDVPNNDGEVNFSEAPSSPIANAVSLPKIPEISQLEATNCEEEDIQTVCHDNNKYMDERDVSNEVQSNTPTSAGIPTETLLMDCAVSMEADCQGGCGNLSKENTSDESYTPTEESNLPVLQTVGCAETLLKDCKLETIQPSHLEKHIDSGALVQTVTFDKSPSMVQASNLSVTQSEGTLKGVLKRNPRGCRGRCDCLNCASFRLHAERAFEFSKHQMQDAEEVARELIKELSDIRKLLENSSSNENNLASLEATRVKEACTKALQVEQLAKERIGQMNDELHYHCRITPLHRPGVTFSISTAALSTSPKSRTDNKTQRNLKSRASV